MKIGIIRIDRMGDMILTLPIIQSIKSIDSSIKIHVFASSRNVQVIQNLKFVYFELEALLGCSLSRSSSLMASVNLQLLFLFCLSYLEG